MRVAIVAILLVSFGSGCDTSTAPPVGATNGSAAASRVTPRENPVEILLVDWSELHLSNQCDGRLPGPLSLDQLRERLELTQDVEWTAHVVLAKNARIEGTPQSCRSIASAMRELGFRRVTINVAVGVFSLDPDAPRPALFDSDRDT